MYKFNSFDAHTNAVPVRLCQACLVRLLYMTNDALISPQLPPEVEASGHIVGTNGDLDGHRLKGVCVLEAVQSL